MDQKLLNANAAYYEQLLKSLESNTTHDPLQGALQKVLLQRLIHLTQSAPRLPKTLRALLQEHPVDADDYRNYFHAMLAAAQTLDALQAQRQKIENELKALAAELNAPRQSAQKKDPRTLQLQYAYGYRQNENIKRQITTLQKIFTHIPLHLAEEIDHASIDADAVRKHLNGIEVKLRGLSKSAEDLTLEKERLTLLGDRRQELQQIGKGLQSIRQAQEQLRISKAQDLFLLLVHELKIRDKKAFATLDRLEETLEKMGLDPQSINRLEEVLLGTVHKRFGIAASLKSAAKQEFHHTLKLFWKQANAPLFTLNNTPISPLKLLLTILILAVGFLIGYLYRRTIRGIDSRNLTEATKTLLSNMGYYFIVIIALFVAFHFLGLSLSSFALIAGALSVGIGFGLQNIVSNFVSGIIIMFERSIKIGDYIELGDGLSGYVTDIRMRSVTITTNGNIDIVVPNQQLIENRVVNWTMNDKIRRFEIPFGVAYGTKVEEVVRVVMEAVGRSNYQDIYSSNDRQTQVIMTGMGDSSVNFKLLVWLKGPKTLWPQRTTSRFLVLIYNALNDAGITIPFPQRDLHLRSADVTLPVRIVEGPVSPSDGASQPPSDDVPDAPKRAKGSDDTPERP